MENFADDLKNHFSKVFLKEDETRMQIPEAFYPRIPERSQLFEQAVVQGPSGDQWVTTVNKNQDGIFFLGKGWEAFVRENGIQVNDSLVFRYQDIMQFSVMVFNMNGIPREACFTPLVGERIVPGMSSGCPPVGMPIASLPPPTQGHSAEQQQRRKWQGEDSNQEVPRKNFEFSSSGESAKDDLKAIQLEFASKYSTTDFFGVILHKAYLERNFLPVPAEAQKAYFTNDTKSVKVRSSDGRSWVIQILLSENGSLRLSKGLNEFTKKKHGMNLKLGDVLIFEVGKKTSSRLMLRVHVFRRDQVLDAADLEDDDSEDE